MHIRRYFFSFLIALAFLTAAPALSAPIAHSVPGIAVARASQIQFFDTEAAAQSHCPSDEVVWLNTRTGIYHEKGMRWYGRTRQGAYVCRKEADAAGYRDTRNGQ